MLSATQALAELQALLYAPGGLHAFARAIRRNAAVIQPRAQIQHADHMRQALAQRWALQHFLPTDKP